MTDAPKCPIHQETDLKLIYPVKRNRFGAMYISMAMKCDDCGVPMTNPAMDRANEKASGNYLD